jgi:hypothetical protein
LWLFFSHALILNKNPHLWMDTSLETICKIAIRAVFTRTSA